jgi:Xaa-Pro dipeptidase
VESSEPEEAIMLKLVEMLSKALVESHLPFPMPEYELRVRAVRDLMTQAGLDVMIVSNASNIGYLTGYDTALPSGYAALVLPSSGDPVFHCSDLSAPAMVLSGWVRNIEVFNWFQAEDTGGDLARILLEQGYDGKRIGVEMGYADVYSSHTFDAKSYVTLRERLPRANFVDTTTLILEVRMIKSARELEYMRTAGTYTWIGLQAALGAVHEGALENEVIAAAHGAMLDAGSELMSIDPIMITGWRTGFMPDIPYRRIEVRKGDPVYFEFTGTHYRYNAPSMRSAVIGRPSESLRRLSDAAIEVLNLLLVSIKPGLTGHDVAQIAKKGLASVPEAYFHGGYGYSIGMSFQPTWTESPMYIAEGADRELEIDMTFHLPISMCIPGQYGIGFSESVVVTDAGCECLTPNRDLFLAIA